MSIDLQELKKQRQQYDTQRQQHQQMFHQLNGAIALLDTQIKKLEDEQNGKVDDKAAQEPAKE